MNLPIMGMSSHNGVAPAFVSSPSAQWVALQGAFDVRRSPFRSERSSKGSTSWSECCGASEFGGGYDLEDAATPSGLAGGGCSLVRCLAEYFRSSMAARGPDSPDARRGRERPAAA